MPTTSNRYEVYGAFGEHGKALSAHPTLLAAQGAYAALSDYERRGRDGEHAAHIVDSVTGKRVTQLAEMVATFTDISDLKYEYEDFASHVTGR